MISEVQRAEDKAAGFPGNFRRNRNAGHGQPCSSRIKCPIVLGINGVAVDSLRVHVRFEEGTDAIVGGHLIQRDYGRLDPFLVDGFAVTVLREITFGLRQSFQKVRLEVILPEVLRQLDSAAGVLNDLYRFDTGDVVEEPAATGVHEHGVPLQFEQLQDVTGFRLSQFTCGMTPEKAAGVALGPIQQNGDIFVAGGPGIFEKPGSLLKTRGQLVTQSIESFAQRRSPGLIPAGMSGIAATIGAPAFQAVRAAPGTVFEDFDFMRGRMFREVFPVAGNLGELFGLDVIERISEGHLAVAVMMAVGFAVGGDVYKFRPGAVRREGPHEPIGELFSVVKKTLEGYAVRDGTIVEKNIHGAARAQAKAIGHSGIDAATGHVGPRASADATDLRGLRGAENSEADSLLPHELESLQIDSRFREPHTFRNPAEAGPKIRNAPDDLSELVAVIRERHDHVRIGLSDSRTMTGEALTAFLIAFEDEPVSIGTVVFSQERRVGPKLKLIRP